MKVFTCAVAFTGMFVLVAISGTVASSIAYDHGRDGFVPVATIDSDAVMRENDKEYLVKKTANLVDLFYETGFPKRIAKFVKIGGALLENNTSNDPMVNEIFEGRKKDKGGLGMVMMMGMMMAKMMGALGFAGVGALAAKALGVSMMALLLSAVVGLKKLSEGGHGGGHSDHHRRRRDLAEEWSKANQFDFLPYRAWFKQE